MRIKDLSNIRRAFQSSAWVIHEPKLDVLVEVLSLRMSDSPLSVEEIKARIGDTPDRAPETRGTVAVIPLSGVLYPKANLVTEQSGGQSVALFIAQVEAAANDPAISAIVLDVDSPGGNAQGIPEAAARIRALRGTKPIVAVATGMMASGAYWLASAADTIVGSPSSEIGSVGAFMVHSDHSEAFAKDGIKNTIIRAGEFKAEVNPFEPLTPEARAALETRVNDAYTMFTADLAKGRNVSVATVKADFGKGRVVSPKVALAAGMIDKLGTLQSVVRDLSGSKAQSYRRASDGALPVFAADAEDDFTALMTVEYEALERTASLLVAAQSAGSVFAHPTPSDSIPPVAEEPTVDKTTTAPTGATVEATPTRESQLHELAALTQNQDKYFEWVGSGKSVTEIRAELMASKQPPAAVSSAREIVVGRQLETTKPWDSDAQFYAAVVDAGTPNKRFADIDPRLFAAASGMNQGTPSQGGFLVPTKTNNSLWTGIFDDPNSLLGLCDTYEVDGESLEMLAIDETTRAAGSVYGGVQAYNINEADQATKSKPKFRKLRLEPQEIVAMIYMTEKLLRNSPFAVGQYVDRMANGAITFKANTDILNGDGVGKTKGITKSGCKITVNKKGSQAASTLLPGNVSDMWIRMPAAVRNRAIWLYNPDIETQLDEMSTTVKNVAGTENVGGYASPLYNPDKQTLKGRPLIPNDQCETLGTEGDLIFIDPLSFAVGIRRGGVRSAQSMHVRFEYAELAFRFMFDLDGQSWLQSAWTPAKGSTKSPIITLQTR